MKHEHYEMIVAKAANFELIQFVKIGDNWEIVGSHDNKVVSFASHYEYFLCLPKHKEACLYWLNGGKAEALHEDLEPMEFAESKTVEWGVKSVFMKDSIEIRIKPKKECVWVAYHKDGFMFDEVGVSEQDVHHRVKEHEFSDFNGKDWQYKEIEVEV